MPSPVRRVVAWALVFSALALLTHCSPPASDPPRDLDADLPLPDDETLLRRAHLAQRGLQRFNERHRKGLPGMFTSSNPLVSLQVEERTGAKSTIIGWAIAQGIDKVYLGNLIGDICSALIKSSTNVAVGSTAKIIHKMYGYAIQKFMMMILTLSLSMAEAIVTGNPLALALVIPSMLYYIAELDATFYKMTFLRNGVCLLKSVCTNLQPLGTEIAALNAQIDFLAVTFEQLRLELETSDPDRLALVLETTDSKLKQVKQRLTSVMRQYDTVKRKIMTDYEQWKAKATLRGDRFGDHRFMQQYTVVYMLAGWCERVWEKVQAYIVVKSGIAGTFMSEKSKRSWEKRANTSASDQVRKEEKDFVSLRDLINDKLSSALEAIEMRRNWSTGDSFKLFKNDDNGEVVNFASLVKLTAPTNPRGLLDRIGRHRKGFWAKGQQHQIVAISSNKKGLQLQTVNVDLSVFNESELSPQRLFEKSREAALKTLTRLQCMQSMGLSLHSKEADDSYTSFSTGANALTIKLTTKKGIRRCTWLDQNFLDISAAGSTGLDVHSIFTHSNRFCLRLYQHTVKDPQRPSTVRPMGDDGLCDRRKAEGVFQLCTVSFDSARVFLCALMRITGRYLHSKFGDNKARFDPFLQKSQHYTRESGGDNSEVPRSFAQYINFSRFDRSSLLQKVCGQAFADDKENDSGPLREDSLVVVRARTLERALREAAELPVPGRDSGEGSEDVDRDDGSSSSLNQNLGSDAPSTRRTAVSPSVTRFSPFRWRLLKYRNRRVYPLAAKIENEAGGRKVAKHQSKNSEDQGKNSEDRGSDSEGRDKDGGDQRPPGAPKLNAFGSSARPSVAAPPHNSVPERPGQAQQVLQMPERESSQPGLLGNDVIDMLSSELSGLDQLPSHPDVVELGSRAGPGVECSFDDHPSNQHRKQLEFDIDDPEVEPMYEPLWPGEEDHLSLDGNEVGVGEMGFPGAMGVDDTESSPSL